MSLSLSLIGNGFQFFSFGGLPLNAGLLYTYAAGTSTPQATYTDSTGGVANSNPIVLGSDGRPPQEIWLTDGQAYKFVLRDSLGNLIATYDNLYGALGIGNILVSGSPQYVATVGGSANAILLTPTVTPTTYFSGQTYSFVPIATNTAAVTVNVSGLGAQTLFTKAGIACTGRELVQNGLYLIEYSAQLAGFVLINSDDRSAVTAYTPVLAFGGSSVGITYVVQVGAFYKVSNMVFFSIDISLSNKGAAAGAATVTLPITANSLFPAGSAPVCCVLARNLTFPSADGYITALISGSTLSIINSVTAAPFTVCQNTAFANNTELIITGFYATT